MSSRPAIPIAIQRAVEAEAGYRCAVPNCRDTGPFDFEHIKEWAKVQAHEFHNIILLCVKCHARVTRKNTTAAPISKDALREYKRNLAVINCRYSLYEMRVLEWFFENQPFDEDKFIEVSETDFLHFKGLIDEGFIKTESGRGDIFIDSDGVSMKVGGAHIEKLSLTANGIEFVQNYYSGKNIS